MSAAPDNKPTSLAIKLLELNPNSLAISDLKGQLLHANSRFSAELLKGVDVSKVSLRQLMAKVSFEEIIAFADQAKGDTLELQNISLTDTQSVSHIGHLQCVREDNWLIFEFQPRLEDPAAAFASKSTDEIAAYILDAIPAPAYFKNTKQIYTACNDIFLEFYDRKREDVIGYSAHDLVNAELAEQFQKSDNKILETGETQIQESYAEDSSGNIKNIIFQKTVVRDLSGEISGIMGILIDVTENRKIEKELEKSRTIFNSIVENSPAHIFVKDDEGRYQIVSKKLQKMFGWGDDHMIGKRDEDIFPDDVVKDYLASDEAVRNTEEPIIVRDARVIGEETRHHLTVKFALRDNDGESFGIAGIATDITELVEAENSLKLAALDLEEKIRQRTAQITEEIRDRERAERDIYEILSISPISVGMTNLQNNKIVLENQSLVNLLEPDGGTLIGLDPKLLWVDPDGRQEIVDQLIDGQEYNLHEVSLKKLTGEAFPARVYGRYLERDGVPYSVFWIVDLTEEKAVQAKIIASENSMREMLAASPVALGISDVKTGKISFVNDSLSKLLKIPEDELLVNTTLQFWRSAEDRESFVEEFNRTGQVKPREIEIQRFNKEPVWVLLSWTRIVIEGEAKIVFWLNDISQIKEAENVLKASHETLEKHVEERTEELRSEIEERRKIEQALRQSEEQFEAFASSASDWFWGTDENHVFNHLSERFEEITGLSSKLFLGRSRMDVLEENADKEIWQEHHNLILNHKAFRDFQYELKREDGSIMHATVSGIPMFDDDGNFKGYRGAGRDLTLEITAQEQNRLMEEQLHQSQKMEAIGQLTGGIAHDFNNILAVILGNVELAQEKIEKDTQLANHLKIVESSAIKGATLTERLLAYSRKQSLRPTPIQLNDLTGSILTLVDRLLGETIQIKTEFSPSIPPVFADSNQLENALMNLCINSRDAMPEGGTLKITTGILELSASSTEYQELASGSYSWVEVQDNGKGMDKHTLQHVFEPFFTTKDVGKGTGLGLSMVYGFAHQSNGTVVIESEPGVGTRARIILPSHRST